MLLIIQTYTFMHLLHVLLYFCLKTDIYLTIYWLFLNLIKPRKVSLNLNCYYLTGFILNFGDIDINEILL